MAGTSKASTEETRISKFIQVWKIEGRRQLPKIYIHTAMTIFEAVEEDIQNINK